jgi:hypothetical protein
VGRSRSKATRTAAIVLDIGSAPQDGDGALRLAGQRSEAAGTADEPGRPTIGGLTSLDERNVAIGVVSAVRT